MDHAMIMEELPPTVVTDRANTVCAVCRKETDDDLGGGMISCPECHEVLYCSQDCQQWHWEIQHQYDCPPIKINSDIVLNNNNNNTYKDDCTTESSSDRSANLEESSSDHDDKTRLTTIDEASWEADDLFNEFDKLFGTTPQEEEEGSLSSVTKADDKAGWHTSSSQVEEPSTNDTSSSSSIFCEMNDSNRRNKLSWMSEVKTALKKLDKDDGYYDGKDSKTPGEEDDEAPIMENGETPSSYWEMNDSTKLVDVGDDGGGEIMTNEMTSSYWDLNDSTGLDEVGMPDKSISPVQTDEDDSNEGEGIMEIDTFRIKDAKPSQWEEDRGLPPTQTTREQFLALNNNNNYNTITNLKLPSCDAETIVLCEQAGEGVAAANTSIEMLCITDEVDCALAATCNQPDLSRLTFRFSFRYRSTQINSAHHGQEYARILHSWAAFPKHYSMLSMPVIKGQAKSEFPLGGNIQLVKSSKHNSLPNSHKGDCFGQLDFRVLANIIKSSTSMKEIHLHDPGPFMPLPVLSTFSEVLNTLAHNKVVETLVISRYMDHFQQSLECAKYFFRTNDTITNLTMECCVDGPMMEDLEEALSHNKSLQSLTIYPCGDKILGVISGVLAKENSMPLETLVLASKQNSFTSKLGDLGLSMLANALSTNKSLRHVDVSENSAKESGWVALGNSLQQNETMEKLYLFGSMTKPQDLPTLKGLEGFAQGLEVNNTLESLGIQVGDGPIRKQSLDLEIHKALSKIDMLLQHNKTKTLDLKQSYLEKQKAKRLTTINKTVQFVATTQCRQCGHHDEKGINCMGLQENVHFVCASCLEAALEKSFGNNTITCPYPECTKRLSVTHDLYGKISAYHYEMHCLAKHGKNSEKAVEPADQPQIVCCVDWSYIDAYCHRDQYRMFEI